MNNRIPVEGHENEKIIIFTRRHFISFLGRVLLILVLFLIPVLLFSLVCTNYPKILNGSAINVVVVLGSIYYLVMASFAFVSWISYYYDVFIVTDLSIIDISQEGIFNRQVTEVNLLRVQDVSAKIKGIFPTLFGYGDVIAETAGENTRTYLINAIPNPIEVASKILALHTEQINREERVGEAMIAEGDFRPQKAQSAEQTNQAQTRFICEPEIKEAESEPKISSFKAEETATTDNLQNNLPVDNNQTSNKPTDEGKISQEDLNKGGEIKF